MLVEVKPEGEHGGINELELHALTNPWRTAYQLKRGTKAIMNELSRYGLKAGPMETVEEPVGVVNHGQTTRRRSMRMVRQ